MEQDQKDTKPVDCSTCPAYGGTVACRLDAIERTQQAHAEILEKNTATMEAMREIMEVGRTAFKLADYVGRLVRWAGGIAAAAVGLWGAWQAFKGGQK